MIKKNMEFLKFENINLSFGGINALNDVSFDVEKGTICTILGPNGSGKTSVFNVISRFYKPAKGKIIFQGENILNIAAHDTARVKIARTFQNLALFEGMTVIDNIKVGRHGLMKSGVLACLFYWGKTQKEELVHRKFIEEEIIEFLEIEDIRDEQVESLPYGLQKKVELARAMAMECPLLLLDEPTAGMNADETSDMVRYMLDIKKYWGTTILLIIHEMNVATSISDRIIALNFGKVITAGTPQEITSNPDVIEAYLGQDKGQA